MNLYDRIRLRKKALVETDNDEFKNVCNIEHIRHSPILTLISKETVYQC